MTVVSLSSGKSLQIQAYSASSYQNALGASGKTANLVYQHRFTEQRRKSFR
jgi:hypothetical protein